MWIQDFWKGGRGHGELTLSLIRLNAKLSNVQYFSGTGRGGGLCPRLPGFTTDLRICESSSHRWHFRINRFVPLNESKQPDQQNFKS